MNKFILIGVATAALATVRAQDAASTPVASPDVEDLRQQVQALTETVKELQQQVKEQQAAKANGSAPSSSPNPEASPVAAATSPSPAASAITSKSATTTHSSVDSTRETPSSRSTARSILTSKASPTSFSNSITTTRLKSKLKKLSCKQPVCRSIFSLRPANSSLRLDAS